MTLAAMFLLAVGFSADSEKPADPTKADQDALQGTWEFVSAVKDGKAASPEITKWSVVIKGKKFVIRNQDDKVLQENVFRIDGTKSPKRWDYLTDKGEMEQPGIYQLDGDNLKVCVRGFGEEPPISFNAKSGSDCKLV